MGQSMVGFATESPPPMDRPSPTLIDARGHRCPVPTLRLRRALDSAVAGQRFTLLADDPMARIDVPHFLNETGDQLVEIRDQDRGFAFTVEKRDAATTG
jgi:tRNA 2-thiouridine synthesizing protein A